MKEIGGYIELEHNNMPMLHDGAIALNCGTNCLAYLIRARKIKKLVIPYYLCDCIQNVCHREGTEVRKYKINKDFTPVTDLVLNDDEWLYVVNYYGQLTHMQIQNLAQCYKRIIIDQAQAYFEMPVAGVDTLYTCRKFFGVPDGAFLYTDTAINEEVPQDESFERMHFLLGRYERTASEFYGEYAANNLLLSNEPIKTMSRLTNNLLHGIEYNRIKSIRTLNYSYLHSQLREINQLSLKDTEGAFAYPLLVSDGAAVRKELIKRKIYIPTLWPNVLEETTEDSLEYHYAANILPLPCDQRYGMTDMCILLDVINSLSKEFFERKRYEIGNL